MDSGHFANIAICIIRGGSGHLGTDCHEAENPNASTEARPLSSLIGQMVGRFPRISNGTMASEVLLGAERS